MILCISVLSVVISPFSFLVLLIWFFFLCFLMSLANGLSILFIFSKNQLLALLIFAIVSLVSFAFISALIFKIHFKKWSSKRNQQMINWNREKLRMAILHFRKVLISVSVNVYIGHHISVTRTCVWFISYKIHRY